MKAMVFVTPDDASSGFNLAGVRQIVTSVERVADPLEALVDDSAIGVVAVDERLVGNTPHGARLRDIDRRAPGLVVILPGPVTAAATDEDYALRLIRQAIGYQLRVSL